MRPKKKPAKKPKSVKKSESKPAPGSLVPAKNGGAIRHGSLPGNTPGTGRPPDAIRAAMRELGAVKGLPFLDEVLDGKIPMQLVGTCPECGKESEMDSLWAKEFADRVRASVDQRLKANEQALKYGMGTKDELSVVHPDVVARLDRQVQLIAARPVWNREELLAQLSEVWT